MFNIRKTVCCLFLKNYSFFKYIHDIQFNEVLSFHLSPSSGTYLFDIFIDYYMSIELISDS